MDDVMEAELVVNSEAKQTTTYTALGRLLSLGFFLRTLKLIDEKALAALIAGAQKGYQTGRLWRTYPNKEFTEDEIH